MTEVSVEPSSEIGGTEITRFNALRHGVLSRYTVLPWENADEYWALVATTASNNAPTPSSSAVIGLLPYPTLARWGSCR